MGLHSPFDYVGYEIAFSELFISILDSLCANCHTNDDYQQSCKSCPAGNLAFECKAYILAANESDKQSELYASEEWAKRTVTKTSPEIQAKDREMAQDYKPECDILRSMKAVIRGIKPHPFFYPSGKDKPKRPKRLTHFEELTIRYKSLRNERLSKWGLR